jgi:hypothetical protein
METKKQTSLEYLNYILEVFSGHKDVIQTTQELIEMIQQREILSKEDIKVSDAMDEVFWKLDEKLHGKAKRYPYLAKALESSKGILLSVNKTYYELTDPSDYPIFKKEFETHMRSYRDYPINVYWIIPDDVEHQITIKYKSSDSKELNTVVAKLAEIMKINVSTIKTHSYGNESEIITSVVSTLKKYNRTMVDIVKELIFELRDRRVTEDIRQEDDTLYTTSYMGPFPENNGTLNESPNFQFVFNLAIVNESSNVNLAQGKKIRQLIKETEAKEKKMIKEKLEAESESESDDEDELIKETKKWISTNEPQTLSRGAYHSKYLKAMQKNKREYLSVKNFKHIMISMGYREAKKANQRVWEKIV